MSGPNVPAGASATGCSVYDLAPTVLDYSGVGIPSDFDGHPITIAVAGSRDSVSELNRPMVT